jgi:hypothetical protein
MSREKEINKNSVWKRIEREREREKEKKEKKRKEEREERKGKSNKYMLFRVFRFTLHGF